MPADSKTAAGGVAVSVAAPLSKPTTRSSIRQSLNLASVGKAFADVISKDIKDKDSSKNSKKGKESSSRRLSAQKLPPQPQPAAPRASMGDIRPPSATAKRTGTPDSKTVTSRRRVSASSFARSSSDEQPKESTGTPQSAVQPRATTLRPRNLNGNTALPKYRPKSVVNDAPPTAPPKAPSPARTGTRRRLSSSDEDSDGKKEQKTPGGRAGVAAVASPADKSDRPISPLPQRAALKAMNSVNTPPTTPSKAKAGAPTTLTPKSSPSRPTKIVKTAPSSSAIPRPPSSSSSAASLHPSNTPRSTRIATPKTSPAKPKVGLLRSAKDVQKSGGSSRLAPSPFNRDSPSPLSRHSRQPSKATPNSSIMSHISEGNSNEEGSDEEDVELLLAPVAALGAPTPAMPRIQAHHKKRAHPQTPSKPGIGLPSRENLSYLSPLPPDSDKSNRAPSLRPPPRANNSAARGSILSWEQLAADASRSLGEDEFGRMLSDIPAPFRSGAASPSLSSQMGIPESPCLSAIDSPGGYGSISQVLLPDVTPSPAVNRSILQARFSLTPDASASASDASTVALLRLQLASVENTAKERLYQVQAMEEEMYNLKQAHTHQVEEMQKQLQYIESESRAGEDRVRSSLVAEFEEKLGEQRSVQEKTFQENMGRFRQDAEREHYRLMDRERKRAEVKDAAGVAANRWEAVVESCVVELDIVRSDRALLSFLRDQVDQMALSL